MKKVIFSFFDRFIKTGRIAPPCFDALDLIICPNMCKYIHIIFHLYKRLQLPQTYYFDR